MALEVKICDEKVTTESTFLEDLNDSAPSNDDRTIRSSPFSAEKTGLVGKS